MSPPPLPTGSGLTQDDKNLGIIMQALPLIGLPLFGPLVMWLIKKDESPYLDAMGKELLNFHITLLIASLASFILVFVLIGIPLLFAISLGSLVLSIIGIVRAAEGQIYRFPYILRFIA